MGTLKLDARRQWGKFPHEKNWLDKPAERSQNKSDGSCTRARPLQPERAGGRWASGQTETISGPGGWRPAPGGRAQVARPGGRWRARRTRVSQRPGAAERMGAGRRVAGRPASERAAETLTPIEDRRRPAGSRRHFATYQRRRFACWRALVRQARAGLARRAGRGSGLWARGSRLAARQAPHEPGFGRVGARRVQFALAWLADGSHRARAA